MKEAMTSLDDMRRRRPGDRDRIDVVKADMDREVARWFDGIRDKFWYLYWLFYGLDYWGIVPAGVVR